MSNTFTNALGVLSVVFAIMGPHAGHAQLTQPAAFAPSTVASGVATNVSVGRSWRPAKTRKGNAWKGAKVGALVGMIALPTAIYIADSGCEDYCFTALFMGIGVPVGAIAGAGVGAGLGALWWNPPKQSARWR